MRRSVAVLSVACMLATGSVTGLPSAAADTTSASFTVDTFTLGSITSPGLANVRTYADASASVDAAVPGSLVLTTPQNSLLVAPPTGSDFAAGETVDVGATASSERGALRFDNGCFGDQLTGTLTVVAATYAEGALSSFAATFDAHCTTSPTARYAGTVQLDAPLSHAYAAAAWHAEDAALSARVSPVGVGDSQTVVVTNNGPDATTAGAPTVSGQHAADYAVTNDSCAGQTLEPAETCTIGLTFTPATGGARTAVLGLPLAGHPRADGTLFQLFGQGLLPPQVPRDLAQYAAIGGVGLVWFESSSGRPPSYRVYRRDSAEDDWEQVADVPPIDGTFGQPAGSYLDTEPPPGATYQYAVSGVNLAGESAQTPAVSATRASSDPSPGPSSAFAAELWGSAFPSYDTRRAGESVTFSAGLLQAGNGTTGGTSSMELPVVPAAGTYDLVDDVTPGPGQVRILSISSGSIGCTTPSGTLTVHEVAFGADLAPLVYAATLDAECGPESPVYGEVRLHSSHPYRAAAVTPLTVTAESPVGTSAPRQDVTVTNRGVAPLTVSVPAVTGEAPGDWSRVHDCPVALPPGAQCTVGVTFTPVGAGSRNGTLTIGLDTTAGGRDVALHGNGGTTPGAPVLNEVTPVVGRVHTSWLTPGDNGSTGVTGFRLYRRSVSGPSVLVGETDDTTLDDRSAIPGQSYTYTVTALTAAGEGPPSAGVTVRAATASVVHIRRDRFSGVGTLMVSTPDGAGSVPLQDGAPEHATPAVSPDGQWVVYARADVFNAAANYDLWKRRVDGSGTPVQLTSLPGDEFTPAWSRDAATLAFTYVPPTGSVGVWTVAAAGGTPVLRAAEASEPSWLPDSARLVAVDESGERTRLQLVSPSGAKTPIAGTTDGWAPAVSPDGRWIAFGQDTEDWSRTRAALVAIGGGTARVLDDPASDYFAFSWRHEGTSVLAERWNDDWEGAGIVSLNAGGGSLGPPTDVVRHGFHDDTEPAWAELDTAPPVLSVKALPLMSLAKTITFGYGARDRLPVASYDVRYRRASHRGPYGAYTSPRGWAATTATSRTLTLSPGYEYCLSVRARDAVGNVSAWSPDRCVSAPADDRALSASKNWTRTTRSAAFRTTVTKATAQGATLTRTDVKTRRITLVVTKCRTCGSVAVYWGNKRLSTVRLYSATTRYKQIVKMPLLPRLASGRLTLRVTSRGKPVYVDGVAFRRS